MRLAKLCLAASIVTASGMGAAAVEMVRPFEVLEQTRRAMIELDTRLKREDAERQKREREQEAQRKREEAEQRKREREEKAQQETQSRRDAAAAKAVQGARLPSPSIPPQPSAAPAPALALSAETAEPRRQPDVGVTPPQQQGQANHPQPLTLNAASARPQVNSKLADPQVSAQAPTAPPQAGRPAVEHQPSVEKAPPARQQVGAQPSTEPLPTPPATGQADEHRPQVSVEPTESRVGVNQDPGEPQGRVQSGSQPAAEAAPGDVPSAVPAAIAVSRLKRMDLYNERGDKLGDVERVVQSADGNFHIVIGAGGFLGIRERDVRIPLERVTTRGDRLVIQDLSGDQVRIMPVFDRKDRTYRELARNITVPINGISKGVRP